MLALLQEHAAQRAQHRRQMGGIADLARAGERLAEQADRTVAAAEALVRAGQVVQHEVRDPRVAVGATGLQDLLVGPDRTGGVAVVEGERAEVAAGTADALGVAALARDGERLREPLPGDLAVPDLGGEDPRGVEAALSRRRRPAAVAGERRLHEPPRRGVVPADEPVPPQLVAHPQRRLGVAGRGRVVDRRVQVLVVGVEPLQPAGLVRRAHRRGGGLGEGEVDLGEAARVASAASRRSSAYSRMVSSIANRSPTAATRLWSASASSPSSAAGPQTASAASSRPPAGEHAELREQPLRLGLEEVVAPARSPRAASAGARERRGGRR